jgi:hypothetical protein
MSCYAGLAKRLVKSCFPEVKLSSVIPVPQLEPLDAKNIIKREVKDNNTNKSCFALSDADERLFKPVSDEEVWTLTVAWAEAKAQERETKAASQTDTDESYDSDDSDDVFGPPLVAMAGLMRVGDVVRANVYSIDDAAAAAAMWRDDAQADVYECVAAKKALEALDKWLPSPRKYTAATIIQAAARGRAVRVVVLLVAEATEVLQLSKLVAEDWVGIAVARAVVAIEVAYLMKMAARGQAVKAVAEWVAATIIQAAARGRAVRAWNTFVSAPAVSNNDNNGSSLVTREVVSHLLWTLRLFGNRISAATVAVTAITALAKTRRLDKVITNEAMVTAARGAVVEWVAAIIIQAAARGRAVRAWNAIITHGLALELVHIYRSRYLLTKQVADVDALEKQLAEQWDASPKYVRAWIKLAEQHRYGHRF